MEPTLFSQNLTKDRPFGSSLHAPYSVKHEPDATIQQQSPRYPALPCADGDDTGARAIENFSGPKPSASYTLASGLHCTSPSLGQAQPLASEEGLNNSSSSQQTSPYTDRRLELDSSSNRRASDSAFNSLLNGTRTPYSTQTMSSGNSPSQTGYRDDNVSQWAQGRRDSMSVANSASSFPYDGGFNSGEQAMKGSQYSTGLGPRDSVSGSSSLSPTTQPAARPPPLGPLGGIPPALQNSYMLHRASISGPVMGPSPSYQGEPDIAAASHAPPRAHGLAAWENSSGAARPHTADGMFGQFGFPDPLAGDSSAACAPESAPAHGSMAAPRGFPSGSNPSSAGLDAYGSQRRFSMPQAQMPSEVGGGKIFSYMPPMEDGMPGPGGLSYSGSSGYGSHLLGGFGAGVSKKRPRRRYDEIERLYPCKWPGCTKSYGTLNHLNAHVAMQKHGPKRSPAEFKDMRKAWRRQKKEEEQRRHSRSSGYSDHSPLSRGSLMGGYAGGPASAGLSGLPPPVSGLPPMGGSYGSYPAPLGMAAPTSRYSMSSVSSSPGSLPPYGYGSSVSSASSGSLAGLPPSYSSPGFDTAGNSSSAAGDGRPYTSGGVSQTGSGSYAPGGLGAYLLAHRGSI